ncbi:hypothetical protein [Planctomicrobium sp. SH527]|uniref:hypothetical protein n=1 Tax=Planctomicrobium sp. SH527 TaxID=3448123 RepID=UPI003F5CABC9
MMKKLLTKKQFQNRRQLRRPRRKRPQRRPTLRFSPTAWAKLLFLRDLGPTEVGGFGISAPDDLLFVHDVQLVRQRCTEVFVSFDDVAVADFFEDQIDLGRIWIHAHPGSSPEPSPTDYETFERVFGSCSWAVMFIISRSGNTFAELQWKAGSASLPMTVEVDFSKPFAESDHTAWKEEYIANIHAESWPRKSRSHSGRQLLSDPEPDLDAEFFNLFAEPQNREAVHDLF